MNRRDFLKLGLFIPVFPTVVSRQISFEDKGGLVFPITFSENKPQGCISKVKISEFKSLSLFEKLWQDLLQRIK